MIHIARSRFTRGLALLLLGAVVVASAETITLHDGSKITGTITNQTETKVTVKTSYGILNIDKSNIESIDYGGAGSPAQQQPAVQQGEREQIEFSRGLQDGKEKGYKDGYEKGRAQMKSQCLTGALLGWLTEVVLVVVLVAIAAGSQY